MASSSDNRVNTLNNIHDQLSVDIDDVLLNYVEDSCMLQAIKKDIMSKIIKRSAYNIDAKRKRQ